MGEILPANTDEEIDSSILQLSENLVFTKNGVILSKHRLRNYPRKIDGSLPIDSPDQQFDDARTIEGWTDLVHKLMHAAWDSNGKTSEFRFTHDFNLLGNDPQDLKGVVIVYEVISEEPAQLKSTIERKPRLREIKQSEVDPKSTNWIYAQSFDVIVAFTIYGDSWSRAIEWTEKFKYLMQMYTGIFKQFGLQELWYKGQMRDALYDPPKVQEFPNRTVFFQARIERQYNINYQQVEEVLISAGILNPATQATGDLAITARATGVDDSPVLPAS